MNQQENLKVAVTLVTPVIDYLKKLGVEINPFLKKLGLKPEFFESPDHKISLAKYHEIFVQGELSTNDPFFGLHAAESLKMVSNILGSIMINCSTPEEALGKYFKYQKMTDDITRFDLKEADQILSIGISLKDDILDQDMQHIDFNLCGLMSYWRAITGVYIPVLETQFRHSEPSDLLEFKRVFVGKLTFNAERNVLIVPKKYMLLPILQPNKELRQFLENHIDTFYTRLSPEDTYTKKVKNILYKAINGEVPTLAFISQQLSMSSRSLQNVLKEEGTSYNILLSSVRKEMALEYLKDQKDTIAEISYLLGFSEPSAFHRRFKNWTNETPCAYRNRVMNLKNNE